MLRASYGRFNQGVLTGELAPFHPAATPVTTATFDAATGGYTKIVTVDPKKNLQLDPGIRTPRTDEYSVGVDQQIGRSLAVAVSYVRKDGGDFIGWTDVGGQYREETRGLPDGRDVPVYVIENSPSRAPLPIDESGRIRAHLQRPGDGRRKAPVTRLAGVCVVHVVEGRGTPGVERCVRGSLASEHDRRRAVPDVRAGSEQPHQRDGADAKRSAAHASGDGEC